MTTYHPHYNGQVKRFNRTNVEELCRSVAANLRVWDLHTVRLTYAYNTEIYCAAGCAAFELTLSSPPHPLAVRSTGHDK